MTLPDDFSPWEHLQSTLRNAHNLQVRREFEDIEVDDDITTPRGTLKLASLLQDNDTADMTILRLFLYHVIIKGFGQPEIYAVPNQDVADVMRYRPKLVLYFAQNYREVQDGQTPVDAQISIRLTNETAETLTQGDVNTLAQKVRALFGISGGFRFTKGRGLFTYTEPLKGYFLQLYVNSQAEGRKVVKQVLDIKNHTPDWQYANYKENLEPSQAFATNPPLKRILGKAVRPRRRRPVAVVRFRHAQLFVPWVPKPIVLVDMTGRYKKAIIQV